YPYWAGQALIYLPVFVWLGRRRPIGAGEAGAAAALLAIATYLVKVCYSPTQFRFPDELLHWRTAQTILATHHLFGANPALPVSPLYPGLENITTALASVTGLSVTVVGLAVVGLCHLLVTVGVFLLVRSVLEAGSLHKTLPPARTAGLAAAIYATGPHFQFFDAMFVYLVPALAFAVLTLVAAVRLTTARGRAGVWTWGGVAAVTGAVVVVTHHVTSWALVGLLLAGVLGALLTRRRQAALRLGLLTAGLAAGVGVWLGLVAPQTVGYLGPSVHNIITGVTHLLEGRLGGGVRPGQARAPSDLLFGYGTAAATVLGLAIGWRRLLRIRPREPWAVGLAAAATAYAAVIAVRVAATDGTELAGRSLAYVLIPVSFVLAVGFLAARSGSPRPRRWSAAGLLVAVVLVLGALTGGWPPSWERLPRAYLPAAYESSVSPQGVAAARWAATDLGPDNRFGSDAGNYALISTIGRQAPVRNVAALYYAPTWTPAAARLARRIDVGYLLVDRRLANQVPPTGYYFPVDPRAGLLTRPIGLGSLTKFDTAPGVNRLYDNGAVVIYGLGGTR
ncbi:MAG TPA: hypothetical protein VE152_12625, partial [Acidimicrobiales bacterium]|nr:hypothetical protein [Acidimicrobiales bacterium]